MYCSPLRIEISTGPEDGSEPVADIGEIIEAPISQEAERGLELVLIEAPISQEAERGLELVLSDEMSLDDRDDDSLDNDEYTKETGKNRAPATYETASTATFETTVTVVDDNESNMVGDTTIVEYTTTDHTTAELKSHNNQECEQSAPPHNVEDMQFLASRTPLYPVNQPPATIPLIDPPTNQMVTQEAPQTCYGGGKDGFGPVPYINDLVRSTLPNCKQYSPSGMGYAPNQQFPVRVGVQDCNYFMRTGRCQYGLGCRFNHHPRRLDSVSEGGGTVNSSTEEEKDNQPESNLEEHPQRPGQPECKYYMRTGSCRFGPKCYFDHPPERASGENMQLQYEEEKKDRMPCEHLLRTGSCAYGQECRFRHTSPPPIFSPNGPIEDMSIPYDSNTSNLPQRPKTPSCHFYMRTGKCAFGKRCKWNHPKRDVSLYAMANQGSNIIPAPYLSIVPMVHGQFPEMEMTPTFVEPNELNVEQENNMQYGFVDVYRNNFAA